MNLDSLHLLALEVGVPGEFLGIELQSSRSFSLGKNVVVGVEQMLLGLSLVLVELESPERQEGEGQPENVVAKHELAVSKSQVGSSQERVGNQFVVRPESSGFAEVVPEFKAVLRSVNLVDLLEFFGRDFAKKLSGLEEVLVHEAMVVLDGVLPASHCALSQALHYGLCLQSLGLEPGELLSSFDIPFVEERIGISHTAFQVDLH